MGFNEELGISCGIEYDAELEYDEEYEEESNIIEYMKLELKARGEVDRVEKLVKKCLRSSGGMKNVEMLWPNLLDEHSYSKLTSFCLEGCPKLLNVFPLSMLTRLQKLEKLNIWNCESLEEIICESQSQEVNSGAMQSLSPQLIQLNDTFEFPYVASLTLIGLPNLKSICHKTQTINWPLLKNIEVHGCNKVEILFASQEISGNTNEQPLFWVNENLVALEVEGCHGIIKIITHSTAKSLVHLETMRIKNCQEIEEMVGGGDDDDGISFPELNNLKLESLPKLESFCSSLHYTFGFPSIESVYVGNCPKMKTFSQGELNTPALRNVTLDLQERWEGNLNSTIQQIFREQNNLQILRKIKAILARNRGDMEHGKGTRCRVNG
ncbi:hypothetical protein J1N35_022940 [Gossypium stocksii]|uniref:Disease resistance protein At4g27190-like leucine-rich repeats domain-containing protein n=1 Tax=Gossypium stocksii TaxID=47602 RepID=A0A9D3VJC7_9ROSI|nr:hypothetical protein J1N35_022940 [Gossypium stocksii]